jgi:hypothetical protein
MVPAPDAYDQEELHMRSIYTRALTVFALALALGAAGAASAFAAEAPEWYSSATKPAPEWQQGGTKLSGAAATKSEGKVELYDEGVPGEMECEGSAEGSAGPGAAGNETGWTMSGCVATSKAVNKKGEEKANGCARAVKAAINGLPWHTELAISEGSLREVIVGEGTAKPGFSMECEDAGLRVNDVCTAEKLNTTVSNTSGGVDATFDGEKLNCTLGGKEAGKLESTQLIEATKGSKLEANVVEGSYSKLTSSVGVKSTGELTIEDNGDPGVHPLGVKCPFDAEGTVGSGGKGTIASVVVGGGCAGVRNCGTVDEVQGVNLPWGAELYESKGAIRDTIVSDGHGTPEWRFVCEVGGIKTSDECSLNVSPGVENGLEGDVLAVFDESLTKTTCKYDSNEGEAVWSGELKLDPPTTVGAIKVKG